MTKIYNKIADKYHSAVSRENNFYNVHLEYPNTISELKLLKLNKKIVLDLGCGSGRYTEYFYKQGSQVEGIDPSIKLVNIAKKDFPKLNISIGTAEKIPFKNKTFDLVFAGMVIQYFKNLNQAFVEVSRVLKPSGLFIFTGFVPYTDALAKVDNSYPPAYVFDRYFKERGRVKHWKGWGVDITHYHNTFETLINSLIANNLQIIKYIDMKPTKASKKLFPNKYEEIMNKPKFYLIKSKKAVI